MRSFLRNSCLQIGYWIKLFRKGSIHLQFRGMISTFAFCISSTSLPHFLVRYYFSPFGAHFNYALAITHVKLFMQNDIRCQKFVCCTPKRWMVGKRNLWDACLLHARADHEQNEMILCVSFVITLGSLSVLDNPTKLEVSNCPKMFREQYNRTDILLPTFHGTDVPSRKDNSLCKSDEIRSRAGGMGKVATSQGEKATSSLFPFSLPTFSDWNSNSHIHDVTSSILKLTRWGENNQLGIFGTICETSLSLTELE